MIAQHEDDPDFRGTVINISSVSGEVVRSTGGLLPDKIGHPNGHAVVGRPNGPHGVAVYEVQPGIIHSDMTAGVTENTTG
ncbi:MAG: hypothetical protein CM1200mP2_08250 [Planctomycetaceae bacterium]|nr:MAG: hypothetical protein CM1200mP2_08250 [Planctomycetaceae bacterium]